MEDPWSTPWAVDTPSASPGLTPSKPKPPASPSLPGAGAITPTHEGLGVGVLSSFDNSPWGGATTNGFEATNGASHDNTQDDDDDAWGGWDSGNQNAWSGANGDTAAVVFETPSKTVDGFAAPWGLDNVSTEHVGRINGTADSAVSFGKEPDEAPESPAKPVQEDTTKKNAISLLEHEQDAWAAPKEDVASVPTIIEPTKPNESGTTLNKAKDVPVKNGEAEHPVEKKPPGDELEQVEQQEQKGSKVQELVDMYDGYAKKSVRPPTSPIAPEPKPRPLAEIKEEDATIPTVAENAKLEEAESQARDDDKLPVVKVEDESVTIETNVIEQPDVLPGLVQDETAISSEDDDAVEEALSVPQAEETQPSPSKADSKLPPYPIDLSHLDTLFPGSKPSTTRTEPVPDVIIDNSFTTTSERKNWYRISRFGSTRMHDSGDEDNYKRITWATSEVRTKTLHIVRRWMEEDSITGRVVLGSRKAGPLGASMFNWDSSEPQIEISELLRQRVDKSGGASASGHARNRSLPAVAAEEAAPQTPTMESFGGWGASVPSTPSAVVQSPAFAASIKARAGSALRLPPDTPPAMLKSPWEDDGEERQEAEKRKSSEIMPPPPVPATKQSVPEISAEPTKLEPLADAADEEDEDEWGEMMSSPTVESSATFAPLSVPASIQPAVPTVVSSHPVAAKLAPAQPTTDDAFSGLDFFESSVPQKPTPSMMRPNAPPPIHTSSITKTSKSTSSPIWTPTMNSPALEPMRLSTSSARISVENSRSSSRAPTPTLASTPAFELSRSSFSNNRLSMEQAWTPAMPAPAASNRSSMDKAWTPRTSTPPLRAGTPSSLKTAAQPASKRVSFEDTCTVDQAAVVDKALSSLPDLSYMLR